MTAAGTQIVDKVARSIQERGLLKHPFYRARTFPDGVHGAAVIAGAAE